MSKIFISREFDNKLEAYRSDGYRIVIDMETDQLIVFEKVPYLPFYLFAGMMQGEW